MSSALESAAAPATFAVALLGNPNVGKSTLFNALSGLQQRVGNYPGCTVEEKLGRLHLADRELTLVDLPGAYSLSPRSRDEMVAVDVLLGRRPEHQPKAVLCIVDATNLERNLYLVSQAFELRLPVVVALNMIDVAEASGVQIDVALLSKRLGVPVVPTSAAEGRGIEVLKQALAKVVEQGPRQVASPLPQAFEQEVEALRPMVETAVGEPVPRYLVQRLLLDTSGYVAEALRLNGALAGELEEIRKRLAQAGAATPGVEPMARYQWIAQTLKDVVVRPAAPPQTWTDRIDQVLTHKVWGTLVFAVVMLLVFQTIFVGALPLMDAIEWVFGQLGDGLAAVLPDGALRSLLVDGVLGGVGGVLVFLPQIMLLFLFISIMEDCGYMARAAYLMDKLMSQVGLGGKSFIPLLSSFACAIPGVMATRVIENERDRLVTILIAPLMSCSARLPVYVLLVGAFIPATGLLGGWLNLQAAVIFAMYLVGIAAAVLVAFVLRSTYFRGETAPFVMELPPYKLPSIGGVLWRMLERGWAFIYRAGTLILAVSILVWAAGYYPNNEAAIAAKYADEVAGLKHEQAAASSERAAEIESRLAAIDNEIAGRQLEQSVLGQAGKWIEPVVRPLGWDWRIGSAAIASFPAREVIVGTLGVIYNLGEQDEESEALRENLRESTWPDGTPVFNVPVALSIMVFFALCAQCAATLAAIYRETNSWFWPAFTFVYMTGLAYLGAMATYQGGMLIAGWWA